MESAFDKQVKRMCFHIYISLKTYVRFRSLASFGIIGVGAPSFSQCVGFER